MTPAQIKKASLVEMFFQKMYGCSYDDFNVILYRAALKSASLDQALDLASAEMEKKRRAHWERDDPAELRQYDQVEPDPTRDPEDKFDF